MKAKTYKKIKLGMFAVLFGLVAYSVVSSQIFLAFLGVGFYMVLITLLRTRVEGVLADERQIVVSEKAAQVSFQILLPLLMLASLALMGSGGRHEFYYVKALGIVMSYVTCLGLIIYRLAYFYFDRKTGGK